jgi:tyrosine-protein kinase Etk/Wzc
MENNSLIHHENKKNIFTLLWVKFFPYWPAFVLLIIVSFAGAWFYLRITSPLFESMATLLIKDEKKGIDDSRMIESLNLITTKKIVENEIEVLTSRSLMSEVVLNLKLYAPVFYDGKWRNSSAYSTTPLKIEAKDPASLNYNPKISFLLKPKSSLVIINEKEFPTNVWVNTPYGELRFVPTNIAEKASNQKISFALINPKKVTLDLRKRLEVIPSSKLSTVINLKLKDEDPKLAEDILNELIHAYNRAAINDKNALAANTLQFVQERLDFVGRHLDSIEHSIQQYKSNKGAVDIGSQGKLFLENVSDNDQRLGELKMQLAVLDQIENYVQAKDNKGGIVPSSLGISDPLLLGLLNKLYEAELQKEKLKKTTGENSTIMLALTDQIETIKPSILENIQNQRRNLNASKTNLTSTNKEYSSLLNSIPQKERDLVEISRQQKIESDIYSFLLQKREEAALSNSSTVAENRVIDQAESTLLPVSPVKNLIYLIAVVVATGIGLILVTVKELFNRNVLFRSEIEELSSIAIIGEIGFEKTKNSLVIQDGTSSLVAEQFRKLRASLHFIGNKRKKIQVTSTIAGEGKSFVAANLGLSLAMTGKKVVIVEADMSNPSLSENFQVNSEKGLSTYLTGQHEPEEIIKRTEVNSNLFVIPAGALPPNPSELITNGRMDDLLFSLENIFDHIVIDTAPVGLRSDAYVLAPLCDGTLYVIRHGRTPKVVVERLDKNNKINELKNVSIVFNGLRTRGFNIGINSNGYGYGYIYKGMHLKKRRKANSSVKDKISSN